jgi:hypothetical protein
MSRLVSVCGCGFKYADGTTFGVKEDGSCCCNDCTGLLYPKDGSFPHANFCREQKEKKAAEEEAAKKAAAEKMDAWLNAEIDTSPEAIKAFAKAKGLWPFPDEEKEKENSKPPAPHEKGPLVKIGATHDASGYPLPGKCVVLSAAPGTENPLWPLFQQLEEQLESAERDKKSLVVRLRDLEQRLEAEPTTARIAEMEKTVDAQSDMLTVKDDRIAELEEENGSLHLLNGALAQDMQERNKQIDEQSRQLQEKHTQIQTMRAQMEGLEHDKATLQDKVADLTNDLDKRTSKWHNLKTRVADLEMDWFETDETKKLHETVRKQDKIIETYHRQIVELKDGAASFDKERRMLQDQLDYRTNKWRNAKLSVNQWQCDSEARKAFYEGENKKLQARVAELEAEEFRHQHDAPLTKWLHMEETKELTAVNDAIRKAMAELHRQLAEKEELLGNMQAKYEACKNKSRKRQREYEALSYEMAQMSKTHEARMLIAADAFCKDIEEKAVIINELSQEVERLKNQAPKDQQPVIDDLRSRYASLERASESLADNFSEKEETIQRLEKEKNELAHQLHEKEVLLRHKTDEYYRMSERAHALRAELDRANQKIADDHRATKAQRTTNKKLLSQLETHRVYRKFIVRVLTDGILRYTHFHIMTDNVVTGPTRGTIDYRDLVVKLYPELRGEIFTRLAREYQRQAAASDCRDRANLIAYSQTLLEDGGEHSPASGSTPESG